MTDLSKEQQLAESATQVLKNEAFNRAFETTNNHIIEAWLTTSHEAKDMREHQYAKFRYGQEFVNNLKIFISRYESAKAQEEQNTPQA